MVHMYSMLVVKSRVRATVLVSCQQRVNSKPSEETWSFLYLLCKYMKGLKPLSPAVPNHIIHKYSKEMALKSDVHIVDVLMRNEASHSGMVEIMPHQQSFVK